MEVIKKITIVAVLIASVVVIITFSPNIYEGIQTNIQERQWTRGKEATEEERWNSLTQEEKCEESLERRDSFLTESLANGNLVFGEWVNKSAKREFESLLSDYWKECETD